MTDHELIELAAKAAGVGGGWGPVFKIGEDEVDVSDIWFLDAPDTGSIWDPLEDDGDALRLAFHLGMSVDLGSCIVEFGDGNGLEWDGSDGDICHARRAIVRAAAEIGRSIP